MSFNDLIKKYLWNGKPNESEVSKDEIIKLANSVEKSITGTREVLITLTNGTKLQGTIKDGIVSVYIDADSVKCEYPEQNKRSIPRPPPLRTIKGDVK